MKALVTGGTGFVGRTLVRRLLRDGWQVTLVTRNKANAPKLDYAKLTVLEADVSDARAIRSIVDSGVRFDVVFHLAASLSYFDKQGVYRTNVQGTRNILNLAVATSAKKFVYASSIEAVGPVTEKEVPASPNTVCRPISPYGKTKAIAEKMVMSVAQHHFPAMILRIGNVYGPGHFSFVAEIVDAILKRNRLLEFLPVYADRYIHPIYNDDVTEGILAACRVDAPTSVLVLAGEYATVGELFQICGDLIGREVRFGEKRKIDEFYLILRREYHKYTGSMDFITYLMAPSGKRVHRAYSLDGTDEVLGLTEQVPLRTGIVQTLRWAREEGVLRF